MKHAPGAAILDLEDACARNGMQRPLLLSAVRAFALAYGDLPQGIAALLAAGEGAALGQAAHRVKGAATLLGAYRLGAAAGALEEAVRAGEAASWPALANAFAAELATALTAMHELTPEAPVAGPTAPAPVSAGVADPARHAARLLRQLSPLLRDGDYAAVALLDQLDALLAGGEHASELAAIRRQFDDLETEQAALLAERLGVALG